MTLDIIYPIRPSTFIHDRPLYSFVSFNWVPESEVQTVDFRPDIKKDKNSWKLCSISPFSRNVFHPKCQLRKFSFPFIDLYPENQMHSGSNVLFVRPKVFFHPSDHEMTHAQFTETSITFTVLMWTTLKLGSIRASFVILLYLGFIPWELWIMRSHKNQEILENIKFRLSGTGSLLRSQMFVQNGMRLEHFKIQENHFLWITLIDWWNF